MLLAALQAVNLFWFFLIWRILYRFVARSGLADERSEDEDETEEVDKEEAKEKTREEVLLAGQKKVLSAPEVRLNGETFVDSTASGKAESVRSRRKG